MLVTEYVGFALHYSIARDECCSRTCSVDDVAMTKEDKENISAFARKSLTEFHTCMFAHRIVRYPKIRMQKSLDGWHLWWIDLCKDHAIQTLERSRKFFKACCLLQIALPMAWTDELERIEEKAPGINNGRSGGYSTAFEVVRQT